MNQKDRKWDPALAPFWQWYTPPCRPSRFELEMCTEQINVIRNGLDGKPAKILILGSTSEFRDWAFEEGCEVTVVDNSQEYHDAISQARRYRASGEKLFVMNWLEMHFQEQFDLVVGDLVVGNVDPLDIPKLLRKVWESLKYGGKFLTKSFFLKDATLHKPISESFSDYLEKHRGHDPFSMIIYDVATHCVDKNTFVLQFSEMYKTIENAVESGRLPKEVLSRFEKLGWQDGSKIEFNMISFETWEQLLEQQFGIFNTSYAPYPWALNFPIYIGEKNRFKAIKE
jgi:ubiquinone/menaquinone biosynthesis C-methylase UbiE